MLSEFDRRDPSRMDEFTRREQLFAQERRKEFKSLTIQWWNPVSWVRFLKAVHTQIVDINDRLDVVNANRTEGDRYERERSSV